MRRPIETSKIVTFMKFYVQVRKAWKEGKKINGQPIKVKLQMRLKAIELEVGESTAWKRMKELRRKMKRDQKRPEFILIDRKNSLN